MEEDYRGNLSRALPERLKTAGLGQGARVSEFMVAVKKGVILGVPVPEDVKSYLYCYAIANIQGGNELKQFTTTVTANLSETFFDRVLNPDPDKERPTVSDAMYLVRFAIANFGLKLNGENSGCEDFSQLPLAV